MNTFKKYWMGLLLILATPASAQTTETWDGISGGLWNVAGNWSGDMVPNNGVPTGSTYNVVINNGSLVNLNTPATISNLTVGSSNTLAIENGEALTIAGNSIANGGTLSLGSTGATTELILGASNVTLGGGGSLTLSNSTTNYIFGAAGTDMLTNQETISGAGHIGNGQMTLANSGIIDSNQTSGIVIYANGGATNTNIIEATAGSTLELVDTTVTNTGGTVSANASTLQLTGAIVNGGAVTLSGASLLQLNSGTVQGGTLTNSATGTIEALAGNSKLGGTVVNPAGGLLKIDNGAVLNLLAGSYPTLGTVQLNGSTANTELVIDGNVTLSGGTVTLSNTATNYIFGAAGTDVLTNQETISGAGHIGNGQMTLANSGTIDSNQTSGIVVYANGGATNSGTIESTGGSTLELVDSTVTNTGGTVSANASTLQLTGATVNGGAVTLSGASLLQLNSGAVQGGTLTNSATGTIEAVAGNNTLGGTVVNPAGGLLKIDNGAVLNLLAGSYPTLGTVQLNGSTANTELVIDGNVTLSSGTVTLSNATTNYIFGAAGTDVLTNQETISGAGHIGNGQMTLANSGTIDSNQTSGMVIYANGGATNTNIIEATAGSTLELVDSTVTNTGGTVSANASTLQVTGATVNGGAVTLSGASLLQLNSGAVQGGTLTNSATGTIEAVAGTNTLGGTVVNPAGGLLKIDNGAVLNLLAGSYPTLGTVQMNGSTANTELVIDGNVTLSGGTVTLSNAATNYIFGAAGTDVLTNQETISGAGHIGNGQMTLANSGTIDSNQTSGMVIYANGGVTNTKTIEATAGSTLELVDTTVTNTGGTVSANASTLQLTGATVNGGALTLSGASLLQLNSGTVQGGTLTNSATGTIELVAGNNTLGSTVVNPTGGLLKVDNGAVLSLEAGTYPTLGAVQLNSSTANTEMQIDGNVTLSGGTVTLSNAATNYIFGAAGADVLTNQETISGAGHIGNGQMTLTNSGTIDADGSAGMQIQTSGAFTNSGTLLVASGDLMHVLGGTFTNFNAGTLTGGTYNVSGTLEIDQLGTAGGEIVTDAANITLDGTAAKFVDQSGNSALTDLATISAKSSFALAGDADFTTAGNFTNKGTLTVGSGSAFIVHGRLLNFSSTTDTLTAGTYDLTGKLEFAGANIETNDAAIELIGKTAAIINTTTKKSGLANFATNETAGKLTLAGGAALTTAGSVSNAGTLTVGTGSTLTVGGPGVYTQTAGTTTDSGTLAASGGVTLSGGSLFAGGTITGNLVSNGNVTPGASATKTGILTDTGIYTQNSAGSLNIGIAGTTAGTNFDAVNATTAALGGTLNISELNGFVPAVGSTFKILSFNSVTGAFTTVNGLTINSTEAYTITYQGTDVLLTVVSTAAAPAARTPDAQVGRGFRVEDKQGVESGDALRLSAALRDFNAVHAVGGRAAGLNNKALSRPRIQERMRPMEFIKNHHR